MKCKYCNTLMEFIDNERGFNSDTLEYTCNKCVPSISCSVTKYHLGGDDTVEWDKEE
ncbi:hypothetical protein N2W52_001955 [Clostridium perfringens]|nr:hypothetical protein [Clostridium perfringens]